MSTKEHAAGKRSQALHNNNNSENWFLSEASPGVTQSQTQQQGAEKAKHNGTTVKYRDYVHVCVHPSVCRQDQILCQFLTIEDTHCSFNWQPCTETI